jgi:hypothetical protein
MSTMTAPTIMMVNMMPMTDGRKYCSTVDPGAPGVGPVVTDAAEGNVEC